MDDFTFFEGDLLYDPKIKKVYRVVAIQDDVVLFCAAEGTRPGFSKMPRGMVNTMLCSGTLVKKEEVVPLFNPDTLPADAREDFENKLAAIREVKAVYGPDYTALYAKREKPELDDILKKHGICRSTFWRIFLLYLQSGMNPASLVDRRYFKKPHDAPYNYSKKPGPKPKHFDSKGVIIDDTAREYFEEALAEYCSGRAKSWKKAYDFMNAKHYMIEAVGPDGKKGTRLAPESERPTIEQFYYYARKRLSIREEDLIKTSPKEQRNNKRTLKSDANYNVRGPGDMVEIDACEDDIMLVSTTDKNQVVGRPTTYVMIDVFSRCIIAVSVAFDVNSVIGVTNLFLNLADDKREFAARYGVEFDNPDLWPSNIIPNRIRVDRGSDMISDEFTRICGALDIEKDVASGGTGSLKGVVEQIFASLHEYTKAHIENYGLIEKRHDSNHYKEATMDVCSYTALVINFVLEHNQKSLKTYRRTRIMVEKDVPPKPALLWKFGVEKYVPPRPIRSMDQFLFDLLKPIPAHISRRGIVYKNLWYLPSDTDDPALADVMFAAGDRKVDFPCCMDMRSVAAVYYVRDGKLIRAPLNTRLTGNADYADCSMAQWEEIREKIAKTRAKGEVDNQALSAASYIVNEAIVDAAKKPGYSSKKNMREARKKERQADITSGTVDERLKGDVKAEAMVSPTDITQTLPEDDAISDDVAVMQLKDGSAPRDVTIAPPGDDTTPATPEDGQSGDDKKDRPDGGGQAGGAESDVQAEDGTPDGALPEETDIKRYKDISEALDDIDDCY